MKAVIMAGGFGTRLRPLTSNIPKPMVPLANRPMMERIVELLKGHGITDIVCTLFYQPDIITGYFGDGSRFGTTMQHRRAEADYGTAGSVRNAKDFLDERFVVISGDILTDIDLSAAIRFHESKKAQATIVLTRSPNPLQFGVVLTAADGAISRFLEKPSWGEVFSDTINTGIYILEPEVLDLIPEKHEFDFSKDLFPHMLEHGLPLFGYVADGYWKDIGSLSEYQDAHMDVLHHKVRLFPARRPGPLVTGEGTAIETDTTNITGECLIGKNCRIAKDVVLSDSIIGDGCEIGAGAVIRNTVIWNGTTVGKRSELSLDVIGSRCAIGDDVAILENVFMSDGCTIGNRSKLMANIKLWPDKTVEEGSVVTRSLVWEDRWLRELFSDSRVTGLSNVEMTPEFGAKLGAAFGAYLGAGSWVVSSRDSDNVSRMVNRALMTGLMSAGVNCVDLRTSSIPIVRHELRSGNERGGYHVRKSPFERTCTDIIFFDAHGKDLPTNKTKSVERLFYGEDFPRASYDNVGSIVFPERATESYVERFLAAVNTQALRSSGLKMVIDYSNGVASTIFPNILGGLSVPVVALNAYLDRRKLTRTKEDLDTSLKQLAYVVTSLKFDIGFLLDAGAEKIIVVDEKGTIIDSDRLLTLMFHYAARAMKDLKRIAVPVSASREVEMVARKFGIEVIRTRDSHLAMMEAASEKNIRFVGGTKGGFIFNEFLFASDGMYSVTKLLEFIALTETSIGSIDGATPRLAMTKKDVRCPWHLKGTVMRHLMKESEEVARELIDGVRIFPAGPHDHSSVLLKPDRSRPVFHIQSESADEETARRLCTEYEGKLKQWVDGIPGAGN